jgi:hypothetical protein
MRKVRPSIHIDEDAVSLKMQVGHHDAVTAIRTHPFLVQPLLQVRRTDGQAAIRVQLKARSAQRKRQVRESHFGQQHAYQLSASRDIQGIVRQVNPCWVEPLERVSDRGIATDYEDITLLLWAGRLCARTRACGRNCQRCAEAKKTHKRPSMHKTVAPKPHPLQTPGCACFKTARYGLLFASLIGAASAPERGAIPPICTRGAAWVAACSMRVCSAGGATSIGYPAPEIGSKV